MKLFVLSLKTSEKRRNIISDYLISNNINFEFFDAVDGKTIAAEFINENNGKIQKVGLDKFCSKLNYGEIGCAMSHLDIARKIVKENHESAIIVEDDVLFDYQFIKLINGDFENNFKESDFELLMLGFHRSLNGYNVKAKLKYFGRLRLQQEYKFGTPICCYYGTYGYLLTKKGAEKLLRIYHELDILLKADNFLNYAWYKGLNFKVLDNPIIFPSPVSNESTIVDYNQDMNKLTAYKPTIVKGFGIFRIWLLQKTFFYKLGFLKPIDKRSGKLSAKNFDEIQNKFYY